MQSLPPTHSGMYKVGKSGNILVTWYLRLTPSGFGIIEGLVTSLLNEDMILALAGQFKQLSHEPEKFRWLNCNGIRTHDLCDAGAVL